MLRPFIPHMNEEGALVPWRLFLCTAAAIELIFSASQCLSTFDIQKDVFVSRLLHPVVCFHQTAGASFVNGSATSSHFLSRERNIVQKGLLKDASFPFL